jgi:hypothetical protein
MKTFNTPILVTIVFIVFFISCNQENKETNKIVEKDVSKTLVKKEKKKKSITKKMKVSVDAQIDNKNFVFGEISPDSNKDVVFTEDGLLFVFMDTKNKSFLVNLYSSEIFNTTPITFTQEGNISIKEQLTSTKKRSRISFIIPGNPQKQGDKKLFYQGSIILEKFTDEKIVVSFKGEGYPYGKNPEKDKLFVMEGKIIVEDYNITDTR